MRSDANCRSIHAFILALDRLVSRGTNVINRITHKQTPTLNEPTDDSAAPRGLRKADSNEALDGVPSLLDCLRVFIVSFLLFFRSFAETAASSEFK